MNSIKSTYRLTRASFQLDVNLEIPANGVVALFGRSGSGKTTLLRCIAGLEKCDSAYFSLGEKIWQGEKYSLPVHKRPLGYIFQDSNLFPHLTVKKNMLYGFKRLPLSERKIQFNEAANILGLGELVERYPGQLSGGQKQRVAIARALLTSPELLLLDEPLASLDMKSRAEILPYLENLQKQFKLPMIYVSHSPDEVVRIADHLVLMENGKVLEQGPINELLTRTDLSLAHLNEACAVVAGRITEHDERYHLTYLELKGGQVAVSLQWVEIGEEVKVRILARDVSIALKSGQNSSITNVFPVSIEGISKTSDPAKALLRLDMGGEYLLSQITWRSVDLLCLQVGKMVYAQVKSVALMS